MKLKRAIDHNTVMAAIGKPKPIKHKKSSRQILVSSLSDLCRQLTILRDGCDCVLSEIDGSRCGGSSQWGHVIPQGASGYLKHNLSNSFRQCANHNNLHQYNPSIYINWYIKTFGATAFDKLTEAGRMTYYKFSAQDLREQLERLEDLITNAPLMNGSSLTEYILGGYYGEIIKFGYIK